MDNDALQRSNAAMDLSPAVTPKGFNEDKVSIPYICFH